MQKHKGVWGSVYPPRAHRSFAFSQYMYMLYVALLTTIPFAFRKERKSGGIAVGGGGASGSGGWRSAGPRLGQAEGAHGAGLAAAAGTLLLDSAVCEDAF